MKVLFVVTASHKFIHTRSPQRLDQVAHIDYFAVAGNRRPDQCCGLRDILSGFGNTVQAMPDRDNRVDIIQSTGNIPFPFQQTLVRT